MAGWVKVYSKTMSSEWLGFALTAVAVTVSLATFIRGGFARIEKRLAKLEDSLAQEAKARRQADARLEAAIGAVARDLAQLVARTSRLEDRFDGLENRLDRLEVRFDGLEKRLDGLEVRLGRSASELSEAYARIESMFARHADKLADTAERTARIEGILVRYFMPTVQASAAQALPLEASENP